MFNFDTVHDRTTNHSSKWMKYAGRDVLPFWVADMDFATPQFLIDAIQERLQHPLLGYTDSPATLTNAFVEWAWRRFKWQIDPDWLVWILSIVPGMNVVLRCIGDDDDECIVMTPIYPPFLKMPEHNGRRLVTSNLVQQDRTWVMDYDDLTAKAPSASSLLLSNPQNPTGRIYTNIELRALADICLTNDVTIVSDEIHWGLILDDNLQHVPIASLDESIAQQTITMVSHTKSYNIAGLQSAVAVIPDAKLRSRVSTLQKHLIGSISPLSYTATLCAYTDNSDWLTELRTYLRGNSQMLQQAVDSSDVLSMLPVEGTHLGWIDATKIPVRSPAHYFEAFGIGLSDGVEFGAPGFVRFNFAAPRDILKQGLERITEASACATR